MLTQSKHIWGNFPLAADKDHGARRLDEAGLIDAVAFLFFHDNGVDIGDQVLIGSSFAQQRAQVMVVLAEETGAELAIGSQADARAVPAERLGYGSDEADFAGCAVGETVFAGGFAALVGNLLERPTSMDALVDFRGGNDQAAGPVAVGVERHEFDEAHDDAGFAGVRCESFDFVIVDAADEYGVDLGGR